MSRDLSQKPSLLIVSDTPMWRIGSQHLALEPVVREIENFCTLFREISWIGFESDNEDIQDSAVEVRKAKVNFIVLPASGGKGLPNKCRLVFKLAPYFMTIWREIRQHDVVHARGPSVPAFCALLISSWVRKPVYWYKYAGNWGAADPPWSYRLQRRYLRKQTRVIGTVNGRWPRQGRHLLSFENPCFSQKELDTACRIAAAKSFDGPLNLIFVGRVEEQKGFDKLLSALSSFKEKDGLGMACFVGGGPKKIYFERKARELLSIRYCFTGPLKRDQLNQLYGDAHILCLPSLSEGFPKVLPEAAAFGCIPIVSDLSCIGQYIKTEVNGLLLKEITASEIKATILWMMGSRSKLSEMSKAANAITTKFTYEHYTSRIAEEILMR